MVKKIREKENKKKKEKFKKLFFTMKWGNLKQLMLTCV